MRKSSKSNNEQESLISNMCIICLHLTQRFLAEKFFVGFFTGIIFTIIIYHVKEPIKQSKFRHDQSKFEYEKNKQFIDGTGLSKSPLWNASWDGLKTTNRWSRHLYLIRHGQYMDFAPTLEDMRLTILGKEQLAYTGKRLNQMNIQFDRLIHSGMVRAFESATVVNQQLHTKLKLIEDKSLSEGVPIAPVPYAGISQQDVDMYGDRVRMDTAFAKYFHRARENQQKETHDIIVFHANILRYFVCKIMQFPPQGWLRMTINHGSITQLTILGDGSVLLKILGDSGFMPANKVTF